MEIAAFVVSVVAALVAVWMAFIARGANARADEANKRATEALDHQRQLDAREREFRDVVWTGALLSPPDAPAGFELANRGMTDAQSVVLIVHASHLGEAERFDFGRIKGGERVEVRLPYGEIHDRRDFGWNPGFTVHWVSPLGHASRVEIEEANEMFIF